MSKGAASLNELRGKNGGHEIGLDDLPKLLGDNMPKLEFHALGRVRLTQALRRRFGANYRSVPGIGGLMQKFDHEAKIEMEHHLIKKKLGRK